MGETEVIRGLSALGQAWGEAWAMAIYREHGGGSGMRRRLLTGAAVLALHLLLLHAADAIRERHQEWLSDSYLCDALVFWAALIPSIAAVALAIFLLRYAQLVRLIYRNQDVLRVAALGLTVAQDLRRTAADDGADSPEKSMARDLAMHWQRVVLRGLLDSDPILKAAFNASKRQPEAYESRSSFARQWVPSIELDAGKLRDAAHEADKEHRKRIR